MASGKTVIVTGGSQGIGAAIVQAFLERGYNVVATSRSISKAGYSPSPSLALVDGDISRAETAERGGENGDRDVRLDRPCGEQRGHLSLRNHLRSTPPKNFAPSSPPTSMGSSSSRSWPCGRCWLKTAAAA